jgi:hypothetical protein
MLGQTVVVRKGQNTIRQMLADPCLEAGTFRSVPGFAYGAFPVTTFRRGHQMPKHRMSPPRLRAFR